MIYYTVLYCTKMYYTVLYCTVLYCTVNDNVPHRRPYKKAVGDPKIDEDVEESSQEYTLENEDGTTTTVMRQMKKVTRTVKQTVIQVRMKTEPQRQSCDR